MKTEIIWLKYIIIPSSACLKNIFSGMNQIQIVTMRNYELQRKRFSCSPVKTPRKCLLEKSLILDNVETFYSCKNRKKLATWMATGLPLPKVSILLNVSFKESNKHPITAIFWLFPRL